MNVQAALDYAQSVIISDEPQVDARYLLSFVLNKNFTWLKTWSDKNLTAKQLSQLKILIERRIKGEPIAYITGEKDFWSLTLKTSPSTLIPRSETELLVEKALAFLSEYETAKVLDLGTGTGAIGLAIASERVDDQIIACDFQQQVVELAQKNASLNNIANIKILQSNWFSNITENQFNLIVANPPYVIEGDSHLSQDDLVFEPNSALVAKKNGLADIKTIVNRAPEYLINGGALMMEHGFEQGDEVRRLFNSVGFIKIETILDLSELERVTLGVMLC